MDRCDDCGAEWQLYGLANQNYPACFKHWCSRRGAEIFKHAETDAEHAIGRASAAQSRANAALYRNGYDDEE